MTRSPVELLHQREAGPTSQLSWCLSPLDLWVPTPVGPWFEPNRGHGHRLIECPRQLHVDRLGVEVHHEGSCAPTNRATPTTPAWPPSSGAPGSAAVQPSVRRPLLEQGGGRQADGRSPQCRAAVGAIGEQGKDDRCADVLRLLGPVDHVMEQRHGDLVVHQRVEGKGVDREGLGPNLHAARSEAACLVPLGEPYLQTSRKYVQALGKSGPGCLAAVQRRLRIGAGRLEIGQRPVGMDTRWRFHPGPSRAGSGSRPGMRGPPPFSCGSDSSAPDTAMTAPRELSVDGGDPRVHRCAIGGSGGIASDVGRFGVPQLIAQFDVAHGEAELLGCPQHGQLIRKVRRQHIEVPQRGRPGPVHDRGPTAQGRAEPS